MKHWQKMIQEHSCPNRENTLSALATSVTPTRWSQSFGSDPAQNKHVQIYSMLSALEQQLKAPVSVVRCDINGLRNTNRTLGYAVGDDVLVQLLLILKRCNLFGGISLRCGEDDYLMLLPCTDKQKIREVCKRIQFVYNDYVLSQEHATYLPTLAIGYSTKCTQRESLIAAVQEAETLLRLRKSLDKSSTRGSYIELILSLMQQMIPEAAEHSRRLAELAKEFGKALFLTDDQLAELELLARLHDIGKLRIDANVLQKPAKLTDLEWTEIKKHPQFGYTILNESEDLQQIATYTLCHHEHWDGGGYPNGLCSDSIPFLSRVLSILDAFDAMTMHRPYRNTLSVPEALDEIVRNAGTQFDPELVPIFVKMLECQLSWV